MIIHLKDQFDFKKPPVADFKLSMVNGETTVQTSPDNPEYIEQAYEWDLGDGEVDSTLSVVHEYQENGTYTVSLTTSTCDYEGEHQAYADTTFQLCDHTPEIQSDEVWTCLNNDTLFTAPADAYQWYSGCNPIEGATQSYLEDPVQYTVEDNPWIYVLTTVGGCSELSLGVVALPPFSGYSFELVGDTCTDESVMLSLEHFEDNFNGQETIEWYQDGELLTDFNDSTFLLITSPGTYYGTVVNPLSECPDDVIQSEVYQILCGTVGLDEVNGDNANANDSWMIYPNPSRGTVHFDFRERTNPEEILIYRASGELEKTINAFSGEEINVADLSAGIYYVTFKDSNLKTKKLVIIH